MKSLYDLFPKASLQGPTWTSYWTTGEPVDGAKFKKGLTQVGKIKTCKSPTHNPPNGMVYEPGVYVWKCEDCGEAYQFVVPEIAR